VADVFKPVLLPPGDQLKVYAGVPPEGVTAIEPLHNVPLQRTLLKVELTVTEAGCVMTIDFVVIQLLPISVDAMMYVPELSAEATEVVETAGLHVNVKGPIPDAE
jgi:hypothetical protein